MLLDAKRIVPGKDVICTTFQAVTTVADLRADGIIITMVGDESGCPTLACVALQKWMCTCEFLAEEYERCLE